MKSFTFKCQEKCDSVKKDEAIDFNITAYRFFNIGNVQLKMLFYYQKSVTTLLPITPQ